MIIDRIDLGAVGSPIGRGCVAPGVERMGGTTVSTMKQLDNLSGLEEGAKRACRSNRPVLVSRTRRAPNLDPLSFFASGAGTQGARNFWSDPGREETLVGLGTAWRTESGPQSKNRYEKVERDWAELIRGALREPADVPRGAGPLLMGGFSFDPIGEHTSLWEGFSDASFILPRFLLTAVRDGVWLTVNAVITPEDEPEEMSQRLAEEEDQLVDAAVQGYIPETHPSYDAVEVEPERWRQAVAQAAREIREGQLEKVVLARELRLHSQETIRPASVLKRLQEQQPHSFLFAVGRGDACFVGASPERLVKKEKHHLYSTCLAGTYPRGSDPAADQELGSQLLRDVKNRQEHAVVVNMIVESLREGCTSIQVPEEPVLYKVRDVQHLFTPVEGTAHPDTTLLSIVERLHPTPALGGYPQERALSRIREMEAMDRGWYAAPLGWLDFRGDGEFACGIRSGLLRNKSASLFAGCGIMGDSDPVSEYEETRMKFQPMLLALGGKKR